MSLLRSFSGILSSVIGLESPPPPPRQSAATSTSRESSVQASRRSVSVSSERASEENSAEVEVDVPSVKNDLGSRRTSVSSMASFDLPDVDLSHLSEEERVKIESVLTRARVMDDTAGYDDQSNRYLFSLYY